MTFNVGHVHGGTGAGRKKPLKPAADAWVCGCQERKPGYLKSCVACGVKRPDE